MDLNPYESPLEPAEQLIYRDASAAEQAILPVCRQLTRAVIGVLPILLLISAYVVAMILRGNFR